MTDTRYVPLGPPPPEPRPAPVRAILGTLALLALLLTGAGAWRAWEDTREDVLAGLDDRIGALRAWRPPGTVRVTDAAGDGLDALWVERRTWVPLTSLPPHVPGAFLAAEDARFWQHAGVDPVGIARAAWQNLRHGAVVQGGSTIPQQLAKNLLVGNAPTLDRKLREAIVARELVARLGHDACLELYLNLVYLGDGAHGVEAAAQATFGVPARRLTVAQAASLAATVAAPSERHPRVAPDAHRVHRDRVLDAMEASGGLPAEVAARARAAPVTLAPIPPDAGTGAAYRTAVRRELDRLLGDSVPFEHGLRIDTPFAPALQAVAEAAIRDGAAALQARAGPWALRDHLDGPSRDTFLTGDAAVPQAGACLPALVTATRPVRLTAGGWTTSLRADQSLRSVRPRDATPTRSAPLGAQVRVGDVLQVCVTDQGDAVLDDGPWIQGAAVVLDHHTGEVVALVGGVDDHLEGLVRATQSRRQPGSTFKAFVYAAALSRGYRPETVRWDKPLSLRVGRDLWSPENFGGGHAGPVTLQTALETSLNSVAVQLTLEVGPRTVARTAAAMGVRSPLHEGPSIALGAVDVTPLDLAVGFASIANGGVHRAPVFIRAVRDRDGRVIARPGDALPLEGAPLGELPGRPTRALAPEVAATLAGMLEGVISRGTGRRAFHPDQTRAGKTGTAQDATDVWFAGFTDTHTVVVWFGADAGGSLGDATGGRDAAPAWSAIVDALATSAPRVR